MTTVSMRRVKDPIAEQWSQTTNRGICIPNTNIRFVEDDLLYDYFRNNIFSQGCTTIMEDMGEDVAMEEAPLNVVGPVIQETVCPQEETNNQPLSYVWGDPSTLLYTSLSYPELPPIESTRKISTPPDFTRTDTDHTISNRTKMKYPKCLSNYIDIPPNSSFFVIKSYSLEHVQRAYKHNIWSSTHAGNRKLSAAYNSCSDGSKIFLFFSVNGSGRFCGVTEMVSDVSKDIDTSIWNNSSKYGSAFKIKWICVRDIENRMMRHLIVPDNQNKPVTNSRDTQLLPKEVGISMLNIFQSKHFKTTSFLDLDVDLPDF